MSENPEGEKEGTLYVWLGFFHFKHLKTYLIWVLVLQSVQLKLLAGKIYSIIKVIFLVVEV